MDIFYARSANPMLITEEKQPFDNPDFLFELKLDGIRCLAYLGDSGTDLRNKENIALARLYPELQDIHKQVPGNIILDGELIALEGGKPNFDKLMRRTVMSNPFKIRLAADAAPVTFVAFDLLYQNGKELFSMPLRDRKQMLHCAVHENERLALSRITEGQGVALFNLAQGMDLEGIVAKRADSLYHPGKRTKDWLKIKYMQEEDFIAAGYIPKGGNIISLVLGRPGGSGLEYEGHVTMGVSREQVGRMGISTKCPFGRVPPGNEDAVWFSYMPLCTVKYMTRTNKGSLRQPVFKGFRMGVLS